MDIKPNGQPRDTSPRDRTSGCSLGSIGVNAISIFPIKNEFMVIISNTFGSMILKSQWFKCIVNLFVSKNTIIVLCFERN